MYRPVNGYHRWQLAQNRFCLGWDIGLAWDGLHRILYIDSIKVAEDTQPGLEGPQMGLYIGVGKNYTPGSFFSGLIDDVRIYNRAVKP
jgi:hypothetical protein